MLLGATLPFTLIIWAGPVAIFQASLVSLVTFGVIYFVGLRLGLDRRKQDAPIAITLVIFWAIIIVWIGITLVTASARPPPHGRQSL